eukprot:8270282-Ditylum_brightwellii.AAC.1
MIYVNELVTKIFQGYKFKPTSFHAWTPNDAGSVCHTVVSSGNIGWPNQFPRERYWTESIVPMINSKYCSLINNATQKMRDQFIGDAKCNITTTVSARKVFAIKNPQDSVLTDYI